MYCMYDYTLMLYIKQEYIMQEVDKKGNSVYLCMVVMVEVPS